MLEAVRDGKMLFAVDQQPYLQGFLPVVLLAQQAKLKVFPGTQRLIPTGPKFITKADAAEVIRLSADGYTLIGANVASGEALEVVRSELDLEPAPAAADVDRGVLVAAVSSMTVGSGFALPERADAAGDVAGRALRELDVGHLGLLGFDGPGELLEVELVSRRGRSRP